MKAYGHLLFRAGAFDLTFGKEALDPPHAIAGGDA
jgi:hypothetical protein